jgi:hypothetical protein
MLSMQRAEIASGRTVSVLGFPNRVLIDGWAVCDASDHSHESASASFESQGHGFRLRAQEADRETRAGYSRIRNLPHGAPYARSKRQYNHRCSTGGNPGPPRLIKGAAAGAGSAPIRAVVATREAFCRNRRSVGESALRAPRNGRTRAARTFPRNARGPAWDPWP